MTSAPVRDRLADCYSPLFTTANRQWGGTTGRPTRELLT